MAIKYIDDNSEVNTSPSKIRYLEDKPQKSISEFVSKNVPESLGKMAIGAATTAGQGVQQIGLTAQDLLTGGSVRNMLENVISKGKTPQAETPQTPADIALSAITKPQIIPQVEQIQSAAVETPKEYAKAYSSVPQALETAYQDPAKVAADIAMIAAPLSSIIGKVGRVGKIAEVAGKTTKVLKPAEIESVIDTAEVLPTSLEKTNIQNIATNEFVRDNVKPFMGKQAAEYAKTAADEIKQVKPAIRKAQNEFYKKLGIKDSDPIDVNLALGKMQYEIADKAKYLDKSVVNKAKAIYADIGKSIDPKTKTIPFGKVKQLTEGIYDLAEDHVNEMGKKTSAGKFFDSLGNALTEAKRNDPRIAKAADQFMDLRDAEKLINKSMRLNREMGEMRLEGKILSSFKDKGQLTFKEQLQNLENILKKYPETQHLAKKGSFLDKIKLAQLANDIATKKAVTPVGMGRIPGMKMLGNLAKVGDPEFHAQLLAKGIKSGKVNAEKVAGTTKNYPGMFTGKARTRYGALKDILTKGVK